MFKTPLHNSLGASLYIVFVVLVINSLDSFEAAIDSSSAALLFPIVFLSLFTLSVAMMAFFFFYQPVQLFLSNKKAQAVTFFLQTTGSFALITFILTVLVFLVSQL